VSAGRHFSKHKKNANFGIVIKKKVTYHDLCGLIFNIGFICRSIVESFTGLCFSDIFTWRKWERQFDFSCDFAVLL